MTWQVLEAVSQIFASQSVGLDQPYQHQLELVRNANSQTAKPECVF